jgi:hypothetical protein
MYAADKPLCANGFDPLEPHPEDEPPADKGDSK